MGVIFETLSRCSFVKLKELQQLFVWGKNSWVSAFSGLSNEIKISLFVNRLGYPPFVTQTHT